MTTHAPPHAVSDEAIATRSPRYCLVSSTSFVTLITDVALRKPTPRARRSTSEAKANAMLAADHARLVKLAEANTRRLTGRDRF